MAKFSVWRDDEDEEEEEEEQQQQQDDEVCVQNPKRIRTSTFESNIQHNNNNNNNNVNNDEDGETSSTARTNNTTTASVGGPISVVLSDPDVLDCSICFEPLTIPVFQCDNGHIACSSCCKNLGNKCPSCCGKIGKNRCRAIEKVIESVKVSCCYIKHGCKETVSYCKKHEHEEKCCFAPCLCPFTDCLFRGSPRKLSCHMSTEHSNLVVQFRYNSVFLVTMGMDDNFLVLQEAKDGALFILSHRNTIALRCIDSRTSKEEFKYDIELHNGRSSLKFQSSTHITTGQMSMPPSVDYAIVPGYFYRTGGHLTLKICVWSKDGSTRRANDT